MIYLFLLTPLLGFIKNYVKYKRINLLVFLRTPLIYFLLFITIQTQNIWKIITIERWLFFIFKIIRSMWRNDYIRNKNKYKIKYNIYYNAEKEAIQEKENTK